MSNCRISYHHCFNDHNCWFSGNIGNNWIIILFISDCIGVDLSGGWTMPSVGWLEWLNLHLAIHFISFVFVINFELYCIFSLFDHSSIDFLFFTSILIHLFVCNHLYLHLHNRMILSIMFFMFYSMNYL